MAQTKISAKPAIKKSEVQQPIAPVLFTRENYKWMIIGIVITILGFVLMTGGKNQNPDVFDYKVVYSTVRITVAPILIVGGLMVEIFAIFKK